MAKGSFERRGENSWRLTVRMGMNALGEWERRRKTITIEDTGALRAIEKVDEADPGALRSSATLNEFLKSCSSDLARHARKIKQFFDEELMRFKVEAESIEPHAKPERVPFRELAQIWREKYAPGLYSPRAMVNYLSRLDSHVLPFFERFFVDEIRPLHILDFKKFLASPEARKDGKGEYLSPSTQLFIFKVLVAVLNSAVELKLIAENPAKSVPPPKIQKRKQTVYGDEEAIHAILEILRLPTVWRLYFLGAMMGGFRRGELLALEWSDVDFENNRIMISKSISWTEKGEPVIKGTKQDTAEWVDMPMWYMRELRKFQTEWREERMAIRPEDWQGGDHEFVFHSGYGKPYHHDTPTHTWRKFLRRIGLPYIRLHDLRHTAATLLVEDGVDLKLIQERLRHAKYETTAEFYAHVTKKASRGVANRLEKYDPDRLIALVGTNWGQNGAEIIDFNRHRYVSRKK